MNSSIFNSDSPRRSLTWPIAARRILLFCLFLYATLWIVDKLYDWAFAGGTLYKQQWANSFHDEAYDLIILGSSRSLTTINVDRLTEKTGQTAINLSLDGSGPADQLCLLRMFLQDNRNTAARILFQVDHWALSGPGNPEYSHRLFLPFRHRESVSTVLSASFPVSGRLYRWRDRFPMLSYGRCNSYWSVDKLVNSIVAFQKPEFDDHGSYLIDRSFPADGLRETFVGRKIQLNYEVIDEILLLCRRHNLEVFMFTAPWLDLRDRGGWQLARQTLATKADHFRDFGDLYAGQQEYFYDSSHLNRIGADQFSDVLAKFLINPDDQRSP